MISTSNLDSGPYQVSLTDASHNPLADRYITIEVDNITYTIKTDRNGVASITLNLADGSHEIKAYFTGDSQYGESHTSDIVIK